MSKRLIISLSTKIFRFSICLSVRNLVPMPADKDPLIQPRSLETSANDGAPEQTHQNSAAWDATTRASLDTKFRHQSAGSRVVQKRAVEYDALSN